MSEMVESAARAAYERMVVCSGGDPTEELHRWETQPGKLREDWRRAQCAAIAAMREPTDEMIETLPAEVLPTAGAMAWRSMIDAALK